MKIRQIMQSLAMSLVLIFFLCPAPSSGTSIPVDLTDGFVVSWVDDVEFGPDINQATLYEDPFTGTTFLSNDPFLDDPGIYISPLAVTLSLDLEFFTTGSDNFEFLILDPLGGTDFYSFFHDGILKGPGTFNYSKSIDLLSLGVLDSIIGLEFVMTSNFLDDNEVFDARLSISNLNINQVPEPTTIMLFGTGLLGLLVLRRKIKVDQ